jgi:chromosome segregation ATPase
MTSPSGKPTRRRQRSIRVLAAIVLLAVAGVLVAVAAVSGSWLGLAITAAVSVVLGAAATRITYAELADTRREAARDRAELASDYRDLAVVRSAEHHRFVTIMHERMADQDVKIRTVEAELDVAKAEARTAQRHLDEMTERAEQAEGRGTELATRLEEVEGTAAQAALRIVELEHEVDVLTAQWQAREAQRKHA